MILSRKFSQLSDWLCQSVCFLQPQLNDALASCSWTNGLAPPLLEPQRAGLLAPCHSGPPGELSESAILPDDIVEAEDTHKTWCFAGQAWTGKLRRRKSEAKQWLQTYISEVRDGEESREQRNHLRSIWSLQEESKVPNSKSSQHHPSAGPRPQVALRTH